MDDGRFDALIRVLGSGAPRRRVLAGLLAGVPLAFGGSAAAKKKKKCKGKRCGGRCIPKTACCTDDDCGSGQTCANGACTCTPQCAGKECGPSGCPGSSCGTCTSPETCTPQGQCVCVPNCAGKECGSDGCASTCGACGQGETCDAQGQCCTPNCAGKVCGDNGCGGSCGSCGTGRTCDAQGQCVCQQGYICQGAVPFCNAQRTCACTSVLEGGAACGADLCATAEICQSTEFCVGKYGPGFVCQAPNTGCCGQRCVAPCGFTPSRSARTRDGLTGERQSLTGRNFGDSGSPRKR